jgi:hypothetical protein
MKKFSATLTDMQDAALERHRRELGARSKAAVMRRLIVVALKIVGDPEPEPDNSLSGRNDRKDESAQKQRTQQKQGTRRRGCGR